MIRKSISLGFLSDSLGNHLTHFPRVQIIVEGDTIQTLFDTGATAFLSEEAEAEIEVGDKLGVSFVIASIFDEWRSNHPDWQVIEDGDHMIKEDLIKVPRVRVGYKIVGPVWFARRKDENFTEFMSQWMDQEVHGAIGGSCLQHFGKVLIDYPAEKLLLY